MIRKSQETPNKHKWKKDSSSDEIKLPIRKPKKTVLETVIGAALGEKKMQTIKESINIPYVINIIIVYPNFIDSLSNRGKEDPDFPKTLSP